MHSLLVKIAFLLLVGHSMITKTDEDNKVFPEDIPDLVTFWDFQSSSDGRFTSKGPHQYTLQEMNGPIKIAYEGFFGPASLEIDRGQWLMIPREDCPALNIYNQEEVSIVAWV